MKDSRARLKYSLKMCRKHEAKIRADAFAKYLLGKDLYTVLERCRQIEL